MSRLIKTETAGKDRTQLSKGIVLAIRELANQTQPTEEAKDLAAFICLALQTISNGIEESVAAWEKRDYWVKADRFRMEWAWAGQVASKMRIALNTDNWGEIAMLSAQTAQRFNKIMIPTNHRMGRPWAGCYKRFVVGKLMVND